jgi:small GTP-binding protein
MGIEYFKKSVFVLDTRINLKIWDTAGQEQYRSLTQNFYRNSNGVIVVYDVSEKESFERVKYWIEKVKENSDEKIKMILLGNKIDLDKKVSSDEGRRLAKDTKISFFETSAKENIGINEAVEYLVTEIVKEGLDDKTRTSSTKNNLSLIKSDSIKENQGKCVC